MLLGEAAQVQGRVRPALASRLQASLLPNSQICPHAHRERLQQRRTLEMNREDVLEMLWIQISSDDCFLKSEAATKGSREIWAFLGHVQSHLALKIKPAPCVVSRSQQEVEVNWDERQRVPQGQRSLPACVFPEHAQSRTRAHQMLLPMLISLLLTLTFGFCSRGRNL